LIVMAVGLNVTGKLRVSETLIPWLNDKNNGEKTFQSKFSKDKTGKPKDIRGTTIRHKAENIAIHVTDFDVLATTSKSGIGSANNFQHLDRRRKGPKKKKKITYGVRDARR
jgi:hypothetical protein